MNLPWKKLALVVVLALAALISDGLIWWSGAAFGRMNVPDSQAGYQDYGLYVVVPVLLGLLIGWGGSVVGWIVGFIGKVKTVFQSPQATASASPTPSRSSPDASPFGPVNTRSCGVSGPTDAKIIAAQRSLQSLGAEANDMICQGNLDAAIDRIRAASIVSGKEMTVSTVSTVGTVKAGAA